MVVTPNNLEDQLPELILEHFGSKAELVDYKIANQHHDYIVLLAELCCPKIKVVIKLAGPQAPISCPFDRTATLHKLVDSRTTIRMPEVLAVDVTYNKWPWRYFIKSYLPGYEWVKVRSQMNRDELSDAYQQIGNAVAQLHTIRFPSFGELGVDGNTGEGKSYLTALIERANKTIKTPHLNNLFLSVVNKNKLLFTEIDTASLCHEDLHQHNILFQYQKGKWQLATILDFDKAWAGFHETDLSRLDLWRGMMDKAFWEGYEPICEVDVLYKQRRPIYQLLWCFEYAQPTSRHIADTQHICTELGLSPVVRFE